MELIKQHKKSIVRYALVTFLCLVIVHVITYNKLPLANDYRFPVRPFFVVLTFGMILCTSNYLLLRKIHINKFYTDHKLQNFIVDIIFHSLVTILVYSILYVVINQIIFGYDFTLVNYLRYLFISLLIIQFEHTFRKALIVNGKTETKGLHHVILIKNGNKLLRLHPEEICYFKSSGGIVTMLINNHSSEKNTQFNSLNQLVGQLPEPLFFKVNRQFLINKNHIVSVKNDVNRKLKIVVKPDLNIDETFELTVSRYLNSQFKSWYKI